MPLLTFKEDYLQQKEAIHTANEIAHQPQLWNSVSGYFNNKSEDINSFLQTAYADCDNIILTGAGTSSFIGLSLQGVFFRNTKIITRAIATTDIVSNPHDYFNKHHVPLVISFARSGNSPESCATLKLADKLSKKCFHLIITCDKNGALAQYNSFNSSYLFVLPEKANDKSLAMTGSYSSMLLAGLLTVYINQPIENSEQVNLLIQAADIIISQADIIQRIAHKNFKRAMFLGSGSLFGTATESALKLQELTDGKIICKADTYLGLRHGPKAVIDEDTLVIYFFSNSEYVKNYEQDLVNAVKNGNTAMFCLGVSENYKLIKHIDEQISFGIESEKITEDFLPVCAVIVGQLLGFFKSLQLNLKPDAPSVNGSITRVVEGVTIYPLEARTSIINYE